MLKYLNLKNLILIEESSVEFKEGLNIVSGETGAGKTALIQAIGLALGERADSSTLRKGADKAVIEAAFDIEANPAVHRLLQEAGIDYDKTELLIVRREIVKEGRNRAFINCQMAPLPLIQAIGNELIDLIQQHSHQQLRSSEHHRFILDLFGNLQKDVEAFYQSWEKEKGLKQKLDELLASEQKREREIDIFKNELQELEEANLKENEEELLFEEYNRLSHSQELISKIEYIVKSLQESPQALLPLLNRLKNTLEPLSAIDPKLNEPLQLLKSASIEVHEAALLLNGSLNGLEQNPSRLAFLEERLSLIHKLKRKYGKTISEVNVYMEKTKQKLNELENLEHRIDEIRGLFKSAEHETLELSCTLSKKRKETAQKLEKELTHELRSLNMKDAVLSVKIEPQARSQFGEDLVSFWLLANKGEPLVSVKESTSGGELSRLMLAIKVALAEKNNTPTIIFDEIDANVGGETASLIGEKLQNLGKCRQVLCITHFPQVACKADHHLRVKKQESEGRTHALVEPLNKKEKEKELLRMMGGKKSELLSK